MADSSVKWVVALCIIVIAVIGIFLWRLPRKLPEPIYVNRIVRDTILQIKEIKPDTVEKKIVVYKYRTKYIENNIVRHDTIDTTLSIPPFTVVDTIATYRNDSIFYNFFFPEFRSKYIIKYSLDTTTVIRDSVTVVQPEPLFSWKNFGIFVGGIILGFVLR